MSETGERDGLRAWKWWKEMTDAQHGDRGALAKLRRCNFPHDALVIAPAMDLARRLARIEREERFKDALGLAIVLASVRKSPTDLVMTVAGWKSFPGDRKNTADLEQPILSESRFRRLLQTGQREKIDAFRRLVRMLGGSANVGDLAESFLYWGDKVKQRWAFEYFAIAQSSPSASHISEGDTP